MTSRCPNCGEITDPETVSEEEALEAGYEPDDASDLAGCTACQAVSWHDEFESLG